MFWVNKYSAWRGENTRYLTIRKTDMKDWFWKQYENWLGWVIVAIIVFGFPLMTYLQYKG